MIEPTTSTLPTDLAVASGTSTLAGKPVARLGLGTMRLTGRGIWGEPTDRDEAVRVVRRALDLGVQLVDTADSYGPHVAETVLREAIHPYPADVVVATKVGLTRNSPDVVDTPQGLRRLGPAAWPPLGRPEYLRQQTEMSLRRLGVDQIDLLYLHRVDPEVPLADQVGELGALQEEGKVAAIGLSQIEEAQLDEAITIVDVAAVQNRYNLQDRASEGLLRRCARDGIAFVPWAPVAQGGLAGRALERIADDHGASTQQIALAWLLALDRVVLPIPGTSRVAHLESNLRSARITLSPSELQELTAH